MASAATVPTRTPATEQARKPGGTRSPAPLRPPAPARGELVDDTRRARPSPWPARLGMAKVERKDDSWRTTCLHTSCTQANVKRCEMRASGARGLLVYCGD